MFKENFSREQSAETPPTHYETLGISPEASQEEIKEAWRKKIRVWSGHQDDKKGEEEAKLINAAYTILKNSAEKEKYDRQQGVNTKKAPEEPAQEASRESERKSPDAERFEFMFSASARVQEHIAFLLRQSEFNRERIRVIKQWRDEMMANVQNGRIDISQAEKELESIIHADQEANAKRSAEPSEEKDSEKGSSEQVNKPPQDRPRPAPNYEIKKELKQFYFLNKTDGSKSAGYSLLEERSGYIVGRNVFGQEKLLDPYTGKESSRAFNAIKIVGGIAVGVDSLGHSVLISSDGNEFSAAYKEIVVRDNIIVGQDSAGYETVLDKATGKKLSQPFKKIYRRGGRYFGKNEGGLESELHLT